MLLLREAWYGTTRFDEFATRVGISDAITSSRLRDLVEAGLLERRPYQEPGQRTRREYVLTESGNDLVPVLLGLAAWGRKHAPQEWTPMATHADCGARVTVDIRCADGHEVSSDDIVVTG
jgi:DNA-binding HxlR family transcriptional regulator